MEKMIRFALDHARTAFAALLLIFIVGGSILASIPRESYPEIDVPFVSISVAYQGVSPEDSEKILLKPIQNRIKSIDGIKEIKGYAREGSANIVVEIEVGVDKDKVTSDIKDKVDLAVSDLPAEAETPVVEEISSSDAFPMVLLSIAGNVPDAILQTRASLLEDVIEAVPGVLEATIEGKREEQVEVIIDPVKVESYGLSLNQVSQFVASTNQIVAAGMQDTGAGRFAIRAPSSFDNIQDIMQVVVALSGDARVTLGEIAEFRRSYKDASAKARINGKPAIVLEVKKKSGVNQLKTISMVKKAVNDEVQSWPSSLREQLDLDYSQDTTTFVNRMMSDLTNNVIASILLVMIVILFALGFRAAALVAISIPGSFLLGMIIINSQGLTLNMMVLFGLILAVGLLVDGAVVVIEYADRKMQDGVGKSEAYAMASTRMFWPVVSSTATTLAAFLPLLFWPGTVGDFMRFLPLTLIAILSASLFMALIFVPVIGRIIGKPGEIDLDSNRRFSPGSSVEDMCGAKGLSGYYVRFLHWAISKCYFIIVGIFALIVGIFMLYGAKNKGVEFFPAGEPDLGTITILSKGNYSLEEMDKIVQQVENRITSKDEYSTIYTNVAYPSDGSDKIGVITLEFAFWQNRRSAAVLLQEVRDAVKGFAGMEVLVEEAESGPPVGETIQLDISSQNSKDLIHAVEVTKGWLLNQEGTIDVKDSRAERLVEAQLDLDREQVARFGLTMNDIGQSLQLLTEGIKVSGWRPGDTDDEIDIKVRYPEEYRNLSELETLRIETSQGNVPLSNFAQVHFKYGDGLISHIDTKRTYTVSADLIDKTKAKAMVSELTAYLDSPEAEIDKNQVQFKWGGEDKEQQETSAFLGKAFSVAIFLIFIILLTQFNSFYAALLVLIAVVMSTSGALLGNLIMGLKISVIMSGVGIVALAGIVVNNNIVLIDTYQRHIADGSAPLEAILRTGGQRLRPVLLTTITTMLGLLPMVTKINIDFIGGSITYNSPMSQIWVQLSTAIVFGLGFATILTLVFTPCMLYIGASFGISFKKRKMVEHIKALVSFLKRQTKRLKGL